MNLELVNIWWYLILYFPSASIDNPSVDILATSSIETISWVSIDKSADHTRSLVHTHKHNNVTPSYLMMDLVSKNKSGVAYTQDEVIRNIVYGILGYHSDVPPNVRDKKSEITNGTLNFLTVGKLK